MSSLLDTSWPRCKVCNQIITKGFDINRVRIITEDADGNPYHIFEKDCLLSPVVFNKEEVDIVY